MKSKKTRETEEGNIPSPPSRSRTIMKLVAGVLLLQMGIAGCLIAVDPSGAGELLAAVRIAGDGHTISALRKELTGDTTGGPLVGSYFMLNNHVGSNSVMTHAVDQAGATKGSHATTVSYLPYGEIDHALSPGQDLVTFKFTGQEFDAETGLYNFGARMYDPVTGRFLSADSVVPGDGADSQGLNRYMYVRGNPIQYNDPSGHTCKNGQGGDCGTGVTWQDIGVNVDCGGNCEITMGDLQSIGTELGIDAVTLVTSTSSTTTYVDSSGAWHSSSSDSGSYNGGSFIFMGDQQEAGRFNDLVGRHSRSMERSASMCATSGVCHPNYPRSYMERNAAWNEYLGSPGYWNDRRNEMGGFLAYGGTVTFGAAAGPAVALRGITTCLGNPTLCRGFIAWGSFQQEAWSLPPGVMNYGLEVLQAELSTLLVRSPQPAPLDLYLPVIEKGFNARGFVPPRPTFVLAHEDPRNNDMLWKLRQFVGSPETMIPMVWGSAGEVFHSIRGGPEFDGSFHEPGRNSPF